MPNENLRLLERLRRLFGRHFDAGAGLIVGNSFEIACKMTSLRDRTGNQFATTGNQFRLIRAGTGKWLKIDPLAAMKHLFRAVALVLRRPAAVRASSCRAKS
jgi:hypothetical protein